MEQLDLDALLARSYEICEALTKANVGDVRSEGRSLKNILRNDLVVFGGYLVEGDGVIAPDEVDFVAATLGLAQDAPIIEQLKRRTLDTSTAKERRARRRGQEALARPVQGAVRCHLL